jgi:tRNA (mo5U34)-methyltransferase
LKGHPVGLPIKHVDRLTDAELQELNSILRWNCYVIDGKGRRFGNAANPNKRNVPQEFPDRRVVMLNDRIGLADKSVVEVGCFEGIHTSSLCLFARTVTAVDARVENVAKAILRASLYGFSPTVFVCNVEEYPLPAELSSFDVMFHVGVLYHLRDPVRHLTEISALCRTALLLDTHVAEDGETTAEYEVAGKPYRYKKFTEGGHQEVFSGVYEHSKWLTTATIVDILKLGGFRKVDLIEVRNERNGTRILLLAEK